MRCCYVRGLIEFPSFPADSFPFPLSSAPLASSTVQLAQACLLQGVRSATTHSGLAPTPNSSVPNSLGSTPGFPPAFLQPHSLPHRLTNPSSSLLGGITQSLATNVSSSTAPTRTTPGQMLDLYYNSLCQPAFPNITESPVSFELITCNLFHHPRSTHWACIRLIICLSNTINNSPNNNNGQMEVHRVPILTQMKAGNSEGSDGPAYALACHPLSSLILLFRISLSFRVLLLYRDFNRLHYLTKPFNLCTLTINNNTAYYV